MRRFSILLSALALTSCANLHRYDKPDAAMVQRLCRDTAPPVMIEGKPYGIEVGVGGVDGKLPGTGVSCKGDPIHRINPAAQKIEFFAVVANEKERFANVALLYMPVQLEKNTLYTIQAIYDGKKIRLNLINQTTKKEVSHIETEDFKREYKYSSASMVIPLLFR